VATVAPICTVAPASIPGRIVNTPSFSATTSTLALSVSRSINTSLRFTNSPDFFDQLPMVASVMDSPTAGTLISCLIEKLLYI
jgi:hypothetical protein